MKVYNRIRANQDFAKTIKNGKTIRASSYIIHINKTELDHVRVGISVSKKLGKAVVRNRIKRQVRAMCDEIIDYQNIGNDIVIVVRSSFLEKTFQENKQELYSMLGRKNEEGAR